MKKNIIIVTCSIITVSLIIVTGMLFLSTPMQNAYCDETCENKKSTLKQEAVKIEGIEFSQKLIKIDEMYLEVLIADDDSSRTQGLMFQEQLPFDKGMLFVFDKSDLYPIWMPYMTFYLDVIWFDSKGNVVHIEKNIVPCRTTVEILTCPDTIPNSNSQYILEVTSGFVDRFNITKDSKFWFV